MQTKRHLELESQQLVVKGQSAQGIELREEPSTSRVTVAATSVDATRHGRASQSAFFLTTTTTRPAMST